MKVYVFPGQGSQYKGMGEGLFEKFPSLTAKADQILGYSIRDLCLNDPQGCLSNTRFTQPALFVVSALTYLNRVQEDSVEPDYMAGHSLGEYSALFAAGAFDFEVGLRLVKKRGELMALAPKGGMAAILNCQVPTIRQILEDSGLTSIDVANFNSPKQTVLSGPVADLEKAKPLFEEAGSFFVSLNVSAPFHSRYMRPAVEEFKRFVTEFSYSPLHVPVISNVHARPYRDGQVIDNLTDQLYSSVQWTDTIRFLMGKGAFKFEELGPGNVLTKLINTVVNEATPRIA